MSKSSGQLHNFIWRRMAWNTFKHLIALIVFLIMIVPFVYMLLTAVRTTYSPLDVFLNPIPHQFTLANFQKVLSADQLGRAFLNSIIVSVFIVSFNIIFDSMAGYAFAKKEFVGKNFLFAVVLFMMMIPFIITLVPLFIILAKLKWIDTYLGICMPQLVSSFGIFMMAQFMKEIPQELIDAAAVDGASEFDIFTRVVIPLCGPALSALAILQFLASWNMFMWPLIIAKSADMRLVQVALSLFTDRYGTSNWGLTMAGSTIALLPVLLIYIVLQRRFVQGISMTGLKL
jgi:multiple sugar transport system permease protein